MKKIINDPFAFVDEMLEGIILAHPDKLKLVGADRRAVVRADATIRGKVGIATGGGSGHLPVFLGYVGKGFVDGCSIGNVFSSPTPRVKAVRGFSDFGYAYVYVIFEDGTDIYWARSRTLEYLSAVLPSLPGGVKTELGPDATGLGWVFQYALVDKSGKRNLAELRSYQDWYLRYHLKAVPGVAEVAPVGGFGKQYQVNVDRNRLQAYGIAINRVVEAIRQGNNDVGGRLVEFSGAE